jgi:hypothetical protein
MAAYNSLLLATDFQINPLLKIVFGLGALMLYAALYQSQLIPRWLSGWGFIGAVLHLAAGVFVMFGWLTNIPALGILWDLPIAVQEMVMAVWLIVKGFNASVLARHCRPGKPRGRLDCRLATGV